MSILLISLPGTYPSFPAVGLEMVAYGLRARGHRPTVIQGHLEIIEFMPGLLLRSLCQQNVWDLLYSHLVYPDNGVGLRSKPVLSMLLDPSQSYRITEDEIIKITAAISRFNGRMLDRIAELPVPSVVGFNVQNNQLLVAKFFARQIKENLGGAVRTIVGGASVRDSLGKSILAHHPEFDFASEQTGAYEIDALLGGASAPDIQGLLFRDEKGGIAEGTAQGTAGRAIKESDLTYQEFYSDRKRYEQRHDLSIFHPWDGVPAMLASGCRWGRCRFCNLREKHEQFPARAVVESIRRRTKTAGNGKVFLLDLSQPDSKTLRRFFREIERRHMSCLFGAMFRCDIDRNDLIRFRKNGLDICHLGIESYSDSLLRKMNKGVRLIDIVKTLITCVEEGIHVEGNILLNLPWENEEDIEETGRNLALLSHLPLPRIINYMLSHGSIEFDTPDSGRKLRWAPETILRYAYPRRLRDSIETMYYSKKKSRLDHEKLWLNVIRKYQKYAAHPPQLMYEAFGDGLVIHDTRELAVEKRSFLQGRLVPRVYQYCRDIRTTTQIYSRFASVPPSELASMLESFISKQIMIRSENRHLSIALKRC